MRLNILALFSTVNLVPQIPAIILGNFTVRQFNNILSVLGKSSQELCNLHLVKTYCLSVYSRTPVSLYYVRYKVVNNCALVGNFDRRSLSPTRCTELFRTTVAALCYCVLSATNRQRDRASSGETLSTAVQLYKKSHLRRRIT